MIGYFPVIGGNEACRCSRGKLVRSEIDVATKRVRRWLERWFGPLEVNVRNVAICIARLVLQGSLELVLTQGIRLSQIRPPSAFDSVDTSTS